MRTALFTTVAAFAVLLNFPVQAQSLIGLTKDEIAKYNSLKSDPAEAKSYWTTRCYLLASRAVESRNVAAENLPRLPSNYNADYVTDAEEKIVVLAVADSLRARMLDDKLAAAPLKLCAP